LGHWSPSSSLPPSNNRPLKGPLANKKLCQWGAIVEVVESFVEVKSGNIQTIKCSLGNLLLINGIGIGHGEGRRGGEVFSQITDAEGHGKLKIE
jgi:hypothetical protein